MTTTLAKPPTAPLGPVLDQVCSLIRAQPEPAKQTLICQRLSSYLGVNRHSAAQVAQYLRGAYEPEAAEQWIAFFIERETFSYEQKPTSTRQPEQPASATHLQEAQTVLQPDKMAREQPAKVTTDPAKLLATAGRSVLVVGRSPDDTADVLRAIAKELLEAQRSTQFKFIDFTKAPWLGFQCDPSIVVYATLGVLADLVTITEAIKQAWASYQQKSVAGTLSARSYRQQPATRPFCLILHQWPLLVGWVRKLSAQEVKEYWAIAQAANIQQPISPQKAVSYVGQMIAGGSNLGVFCYLSGQSSDAKFTGLGAEVSSLLSVVAVGTPESGYEQARSLLDAADSEERPQLLRSYAGLRRGRSALLTTSLRLGAVWPMPPHYADWRGVTAVSAYQDDVAKVLS